MLTENMATQSRWKSRLKIVIFPIFWIIIIYKFYPFLMIEKFFPLNLMSNDDKFQQELYQQDNFIWSERLQDWTISSDSSVQDSLSQFNLSNCLWPEQNKKSTSCSRDRIIEQLLLQTTSQSFKEFKIMFFGQQQDQLGNSELFKQCNINKCSMTNEQHEADAIIFPNSDTFVTNKDSFLQQDAEKKTFSSMQKKSRWEQIWIALLLESPINTFDVKFKRKNRSNSEKFNWTATYRSDSTIVTPYSKFVPFHHKLDEFFSLKKEQQFKLEQWKKMNITFHEKKAKIAWLVSNCYAKNNRFEYAKKLSKFIEVDIYGKCGTKIGCDKRFIDNCVEMIGTNYKFYLSFENSNAIEYITEKLYKNAFGYNDLERSVIPIVLGASRLDYKRLAPPGSFIHVDDFDGPKELAEYLEFLDRSKESFQNYFRWRKVGRFIDTKFLCRVCAMLHQSFSTKHTQIVYNLTKWWLEE